MSQEFEEIVFPFIQEHFVQMVAVMGTIGLLSLLGRCIPSGRAFLLLALPIPFCLLGFVIPFSPSLIHLYNIGILILLMVDRFLLSGIITPPTAQRLTENKWSLNRDNAVSVEIINPNNRPLSVQIADHIPPGMPLPAPLKHIITLATQATETLTYTLHPLKRGKYMFGALRIKHKSALGLLWITQKLDKEHAVKVYPDLVRLRQIQVRYTLSAQSGELRHNRVGTDGTEFAGLRAYVPGDDIKRMDWRATARLDNPITRTFSLEVDQPLLILLDAGRKMALMEEGLTKFDWALNAALGLTAVSLKRGDQVAWGVFHHEIVNETPFLKGIQRLNEILDTVYDLAPSHYEPDYETLFLQFARKLKRRTLVIIFTDLVDPIASQNLIRGLKSFSHNHLLLLVTLSDMTLLQTAGQTPETVSEAYEKAVALDLLDQRQKAKAALSPQHNIVVIDEPPANVDETLINHYLRIKAKSRL